MRGKFLWVALALAASGVARSEEVVSYHQELWFDALYNEQGTVVELVPFDEASQPKGLWEQIGARVRQAAIPPVMHEGKPASFRTGVVISLQVDKDASGAGTVSLKGMNFLPLPIERYAASYPKDARRIAGWEGEFRAICTVSTEGRCSNIDVKAPAGMSWSIRRFARVSLQGWRFKPQELNGQPVEGEYPWSVIMRTGKEFPVDFRDIRKL